MNNALMDYLDVFCTAYLDDILIYSNNALEHEEHVRKVLLRLREHGLQADIKKCEFKVTETKFLGFIIGTEGVKVDPAKIEVVATWKPPRTVKAVQSFLGFCNFYRRFIRDYSRIAKPLTQLTKLDHQFHFNKDCSIAFEELKRRLTTAPILAHYEEGKQCLLETDASDAVVAAVFSQKGLDNEWHPVAYFSKTMAPAELNYPIHDKEMLAIIRAFEHWRAELEGTEQHIEVLSDHKALEYFMTTKELTSRQARWAEVLARFNFKIMYRPGKLNKADPLTRMHNDDGQYEATKRSLRQQTLLAPETLDPEVARELRIFALEAELSPLAEHTELIDDILQQNRNSQSLDTQRALAQHNEKGWELRNGLLMRNGKLTVPEALRTQLIATSHSTATTAHPGRNKTLQILKQRYYWNKMDQDIETFVRNCHHCRRSTIPRDKSPGLLKPLAIPDRPWQHLSVDFKSFPLDKKGYNNIAVFVDRFGKRPISIPCKDTVNAKELALLYIQFVYKYYGPATTIVSDRGRQFVSEFWHEFNKILGTKILLSTAHHPQTDGQTENANQYIDQRLRPFVNYYQDDWSDLIHIIDFAAAALPHDSTSLSSFMVEMGYEPRTHFDWERPEPNVDVSADIQKSRENAVQRVKQIQEVWRFAQGNIAKAQEKQEIQANKHRRPVDFDVGDKVWVMTKHWNSNRPSRKLGHQMEGPYPIVEKRGYSYKLKLPNYNKVHPVFPPDRLRKHPDNPLPGQLNEEPVEVEYNGAAEYEVEEILGVRKQAQRRLQYRVKWVGMDHDEEWYDPEGFKGAPHKLREFHEKYPKLPGPPINLGEWIRCWEEDDEPEAKPDDNLMKAGLGRRRN
jgi:transposase InsO family protein